MLLLSEGRSCQEWLSYMEESYWGRGKKLQIKSWNECGYGRKGRVHNGCVCDHKRIKNEDVTGWYACWELQKKEVSPTKRHWIKWEKDKMIHKDVVDELHIIQEVEDKPLEMCMDVLFDLKLARLITPSTGLNGEGLL